MDNMGRDPDTIISEEQEPEPDMVELAYQYVTTKCT